MTSKLVQSSSDRTPFWGHKSVSEFKYLQQILNNKNSQINNFNRNCFRELLKTLSKFVSKLDESNLENSSVFQDKIKSISDQYQISVFHLIMIYASLFKLSKAALRTSSLKQDILTNDLIEFLKFPNEYATDFSSVIFNQKKENIDNLFIKIRPQYPHLKCVSWRVDVSISTSSLSRTLEPTIIIQLHLSNNQKCSFEMSLNSFHLLRFNVAFVLKEIEDLLNRPTLKLPD